MTDRAAEWEGTRVRIHRALVENSARFHPKIIIYEGMAGWGAIYSRLVEGLQRLGWRRDGDNWRPPTPGMPARTCSLLSRAAIPRARFGLNSLAHTPNSASKAARWYSIRR